MPIANFGIKAGISYQNEKGVNLGIFNIYQGPLDKRFKTVHNPSPGSYNKLNFYCSLNFSELMKLSSEQKISVFLQGDNMLNVEIWLPDCRTTPGTSGESIPSDPGRMLYTGVKVTL